MLLAQHNVNHAYLEHYGGVKRELLLSQILEQLADSPMKLVHVHLSEQADG